MTEPTTTAAPTCAICGKPATCLGEYETCTGIEEYACDDCCGHGNEDGHCRPVAVVIDGERWIVAERRQDGRGADGRAVT